MKKKLNIFIIMLLVTTLFFGFMSVPIGAELVTGSNHRIDWDGFAYGVTSDSGTFFSWERTLGDDFRVYADYVNTSPKALYMEMANGGELYDDAPDRGNININLPYYIDSVHMDIEITNVHTSGTKGYMRLLRFYNGTDIICQIAYKNQYSDFTGAGYAAMDEDSKFWVYNYTTEVWDELGSLSNNVVYDVDIDIIPSATREKCQVTITRSGTPYVFDWRVFANEGMLWSNITRINFHSVADNTGTGFGNGVTELLDDILFEHPSAPIPETYDVSMWDYKGKLVDEGLSITLVNDMFIEERRIIKMTTEIKAVDLLVEANQISDISGELSDYWLSINGNTPISPVAFIPYGARYLIRWYWTNITCNDQYPTFEFYCSEKGTTYPYYWMVHLTTSDTDNDNDLLFAYGSDSDDWADGLYNQGDAPYSGSDLNYRFYFPFGDIYKAPCGDIDAIDTNENIYNQFDDVFITYIVSNLLYPNRLVITRDTIEIYNNSFSGCSGFYVFTPIHDGSYTAEIFRNGETMATCSFTVNALDSDYWLYTIPNPSAPSESFTIYFNYNYSLHDCAILLYDCWDLDTPYKTWIFENVPINSSIQYMINAEGVYYFDLAYRFFDNNTNNYVYTSLIRKTHTVKNTYTNVIYAQFESIDIDGINILWGSHNYLGRNVQIRINGEIMPISGGICNMLPSTFSEMWFPVYSGDYLAELILIQSDTTFILSNCTFSVGGDVPPPEDEEEEDAWIVLGEYKLWLGVGIVVIFLLLPLAISIKAYVDVPLIVYVAMGSIGVGISVSLGLLEMYWLLLLLVALVTGAVISKWGL